MRETDDMITVASRSDVEPLIVGSAMSDRRGHSLKGQLRVFRLGTFYQASNSAHC